MKFTEFEFEHYDQSVGMEGMPEAFVHLMEAIRHYVDENVHPIDNDALKRQRELTAGWRELAKKHRVHAFARIPPSVELDFEFDELMGKDPDAS